MKASKFPLYWSEYVVLCQTSKGIENERLENERLSFKNLCIYFSYQFNRIYLQYTKNNITLVFPNYHVFQNFPHGKTYKFKRLLMSSITEIFISKSSWKPLLKDIMTNYWKQIVSKNKLTISCSLEESHQIDVIRFHMSIYIGKKVVSIWWICLSILCRVGRKLWTHFHTKCTLGDRLRLRCQIKTPKSFPRWNIIHT